MEHEFPVPAKFLFQTLFEGTCDFWKEFLKGKGSFGKHKKFVACYLYIKCFFLR